MTQASPLYNSEDHERVVNIVGSNTRRLMYAIVVFLLFALPSLGMGAAMVVFDLSELPPMDFQVRASALEKAAVVASWILTTALPSLVLIWALYTVQTKLWFRRLIVQSYFRRTLQILFAIRLTSYMCFMFLDAFIGLIAVAGIALTAEFIGNFIGAANVSPESLGPVLGFLIAGIVIMMHLVVWGLLMMIVGAIASGVMKQTVFPCLWCGHELHPTVPDRCPECGIGLHEEELDRAGRRGAYRPISSNDSATNHFHDSPPNP